MPSSVIAMGMSACSAKRAAPHRTRRAMTPWPARMTGRSPARSGPRRLRSARRSIAGARGVHGRRRRRRVPVELALRLLRILGDVDAGPGRDGRLRATRNASRTAGATSAARLTR